MLGKTEQNKIYGYLLLACMVCYFALDRNVYICSYKFFYFIKSAYDIKLFLALNEKTL